MTRIAVYPGTFDPVTLGHVDIVQRATRVVDHLIVAIARESSKTPLFNLEERLALLQASLEEIDIGDCRLEILAFDGLLMRFVEARSATLLVRGLRAVSDFEYEFQMASMNSRLNPSIETFFLPASETSQFIASSMVKEIARLGGNVSSFVTPAVNRALSARFAAS